MCLIGYEDQANVPGGGFFILRNSWFGHWGQQSPYGSGNGVIPYDYIKQHNWEALTL
jgi:C1A family cysteine protease